jgi:regulator of PEP synthase PpsR (kinase-PPPase family)
MHQQEQQQQQDQESQRQQEHLMILYLALVALLSFDIHQICLQVKIQRLDVAHFAGQLQM